MRILLVLALAIFLPSPGSPSLAQGPSLDSRLYELRIYHAADGKLEALENRFRDHTCQLFEKHGMTNIGYWEPIENEERLLVYVLAYPDRNARDASWKAFLSDPDWKSVYQESERDGTLVEKVEASFLQATDFSPAIASAANGNRVFELRTYTAADGRLEALLSRFRDHTTKLFEKHGMQNIAYWVLAEGQPDANNRLIYLLAHPSLESARSSFSEFRNDPEWKRALQASEAKAGGPLTVPQGVKSQMLRATDFSPIR